MNMQLRIVLRLLKFRAKRTEKGFGMIYATFPQHEALPEIKRKAEKYLCFM